MAGHSKWANIRFRKGAQDAKRGKLFTKLIREITVATKAAGPDPDNNPRLRAAVDKGLSNNMKRDTIETAIKKGSGTTDSENFDEIRYEGYGPAGIAIIVDCLTDNKNRTVAEVRHAFSKAGGNLGTSGSVDYMFQKLGVISLSSQLDEDRLMDAAIEAGADDVITHDDGSFEVLTPAEDFMMVRDALVESGFSYEHAEVTLRADNLSPVNEKDAEKVLRLLDVLEDLDDVQNVYSNVDYPDEIMNSAE
ncbi:YebC/PmpR family DNA-binding transcriptional regulator [Cycloclasticus pugetii]|jgi:YebC/PmpR family DNA-binding regulatory protein|uniref:YebC/PmpR family DNA-binding transcriptional regulator n=1 Tax=Cycloclasticus pugetii TaxID=34068 RepID=UPI0009210599|nr:YebC/PmpR family DNA-binding transcriptional regulator [Cycloclasticus pugetii]SHI88294.1 DNA-binding regulatory protein, YebC/PmpR family [Cycloclasticus pugetii]|tara:strand:+ start:1257 stop:2003 length:747 start_codon:yes stop_codon:yes gene_type:complete